MIYYEYFWLVIFNLYYNIDNVVFLLNTSTSSYVF